jgi:hypothetical protein
LGSISTQEKKNGAHHLSQYVGIDEVVGMGREVLIKVVCVNSLKLEGEAWLVGPAMTPEEDAYGIILRTEEEW